MQMCCRVSFAALLGLLATHAATAATLFVPTNFPTIQDAVAAASSGDTIVVAPGTYTEQIDLLGKSLVLQASGDANNTIISGFAAPIIRASNANNVVLRGFTLSGIFGGAGAGGAVLSENTSLTVDACTITSNSVIEGAGAAIYVNGGGLTLLNSTISNNSASFVDAAVAGVGAAVSINNATATITATTFVGNLGTNMGGG
ncbi:MAG TPA: hypothetical protein VK157_03165, partial [Phycisphaerales bacterium]|nr:hypothetical protein [Phycisphaerales bacterium]